MSLLLELLERPVVEAAQGLLGRRLTSTADGVETAVLLSEVEAYAGEEDPASHAYRGRTARNAVMFGPPGHLYVYRSYGIHWCMNVVCGSEGVARAVLLRAGHPVEGVSRMVERRRRHDHLTDGPGKLAQALGVTGEENGASLSDGPLRLGDVEAGGAIMATARIGVSKAQDRLWRFVLKPDG